ncbi:uncharacterized protein BDZ99DRAFT_524312 [Mytilinidion resinicola]|uniref:BAH domain-containing protein n=1 Tax=Mytilinidion resinicola TaxID=574789 RepID=A0A6A6YB77_9PEZI|nr:uncharacterized protein BDZ99DRAFT_524312 [Mytilinidion resinicola]KAF2806086.1 hypothetical protein BDZ99DRAFT_524312 [Mytilinidion resinicola]
MPPRKSRTPRASSSNSHAPTPPQPTNGNGNSNSKTPPTVTKEEPEPERERTDWSKFEENDPNFDGFKIKMRKIDQPEPPLSKKRKRDEPLYSTPNHQPNPFDVEELDLVYSVAPAHYWEDTSRYRKFTVFDKTFEVNDFVFVRPSAELERENAHITSWVAKVLEVRAGDEQHVYLRVYWMYRPEDLPYPGRRPYHGLNEIIATNDMQIIDATTVQDSANVIHYVEEENRSQLLEGDQLFWRQTFDLLHDKKTPGLSELNKHCICKTPFNPSHDLIQCDSCDRWLHAPCIEEKVLQAVHKERGLPFAKKQRGKRKSSVSGGAVIPDPEASFKAEVVAGTHRTVVRITDLRTGTEDTKEEKSWEEEIKCLLCKNIIDANANGGSNDEANGEENGHENGISVVALAERHNDSLAAKIEEDGNVKPKTETKIEDTDETTDAPFQSLKKRRLNV